ncbi:MAG: ABC transporter substrate-binding protein [Erysipelotrichaceae bacterium]|nr:ABC transporter substrate-binding protein [Erysipelotrichaceae bacterium]
MKKLLSAILAVMMVLSLAACTKPVDPTPKPAEEGKVFNLWTWNDEFWGFLVKYYADEKVDDFTVKKGDVTIKRTTYVSDNMAYQDALDAALLAQETAAADDKVDMFLAEADYIIKYVDSSATMDVKSIGVTDFSNTYKYTVQAATDSKGVVKGVSFQCCPSALIYRRSIAKEVLGTDDPTAVQEALSSWDKFDAVAETAKGKGYYMIATPMDTYRVFSNNVTSAWVENGKLTFDANIEAWMEQAEKYVKEGYAANAAGVWDAEKTNEMFATGKSMCFFGPAWYFNFCMGNAQDPEKGCFGDWAICMGPQAHFWGGTWMLAATGTDNPTMVADIMNTFINNADVCEKLVKDDAQFSNNQVVNNKLAADTTYGNAFLGNQNDVTIFAELAKNIKFEHITPYDQGCNEGLQKYFQEYLKGEVDKDTAIANFKDYIKTAYPSITVE